MPKKKQKTETIPRRNFLKLSAASSLLPFLISRDFYKNNKWDFTTFKPDNEEAPKMEELRKNYVPLCSEQLMSQNYESEDFKAKYSSAIIQEMRKRGFGPETPHEVILTEQYFGMPGSEQRIGHLIEYSKIADTFLRSRVRGLLHKNIEWVMLKKGQDFSRGFNNAGFAGIDHCDIRRAKVINKESPEKSFQFYEIFRKPGGFHHVSMDKNSNPELSFIFIGCGESALVAPFEEIMPISTTNAKLFQYAKTAGMEKAVQVNEAVSESISYILGMEIVSKIGIPNGENFVKSTFNDLEKTARYAYVNNAIIWMKKNGIQNGYDLYMDSPAKFMMEIEKI